VRFRNADQFVVTGGPLLTDRLEGVPLRRPREI